MESMTSLTGDFERVGAAGMQRRLTPALAISLFLILGLLETSFALVVFQRSDDHQYFVAVADFGADAVADSNVGVYDLKARIAAEIFYVFSTPVRFLGGGDVFYLMWLRILFLLGLICGFEGVRRLTNGDSYHSDGSVGRARFMALCLLYPGQLAWTASLLRDGLACAIFFLALLLWAYGKRVLALLPFALSLTLRPEFALIAVLIGGACFLSKRFVARHRGWWLLAGCTVMSLLLYVPRRATSEFSIFAFGDDGAAYPAVESMFDFPGYGRVFLQGLVDPVSIASPLSGSIFGLVETIFFCGLVLVVLQRLRRVGSLAAGMLAGGVLSLWLFAYFEIFVSGFSRHRVAIVIILIALLVCTRRGGDIDGRADSGLATHNAAR